MPGGIHSDGEFWQLLSKKNVVQEPVNLRYGKGLRPLGEFSGPGRLASPYEGLILNGDELLFDRKFFGMSVNELMQTEPQVRMLLNCSWEAIEHAGWDLHSLRNSPTGVFVGAQVPAVANWRPLHGVTEYSVSSISLAMLANKVSYYFNLMGSSATYCTACSAGLSALHAAMNALACGDCDQALVGAVTYLGSARLSSSFNLMGVISPDGMCHSFDAEANGYMRSEGSFVFAIKPLDKAEKDGDSIYAVIEATAVNSAGSADGTDGLAPGRFISAPTQHAQVALMRQAYLRADRSPSEFDYLEAHATGTVVGDRIEGNAIAEAFGGDERTEALRVSSVKSNIGHMEAAAFHCALLKIVLMMRRREFAPNSKNYKVPNPEIEFDSCPMQVQTRCEPFPDHPVLVGINSFGFGGANGHCVVREYRPKQSKRWSVPLAPNAGFMVPLSARTPKALVESARRLNRVLGERKFDLYDLVGNLSCRRTHFGTRTAFAVNSQDDLCNSLEAFVESESPIASVEDGDRRIAMVFAGQGTQWAGCGRALFESHPVFRRAVDAIDCYWKEHASFSLRQACFNASQKEIDECELAQPEIFMIQCALVELFKTCGVFPDCVVGHSSGEVAAAYASGALSLEDATRLVFNRATLQQRLAGSGRMLAIGLDRGRVEELIESLGIPCGGEPDPSEAVEIACENSPANTVICGRETILHTVAEELDRRNLQSRLIPGNIAFHSQAMNSIKEDVFASLAFLEERDFDLDVPFVSSVTGIETTKLDKAYWWSNIRKPVLFAQAMETLIADHKPDIILEIAPHSALQPIISQCAESRPGSAAIIPTLMRDNDTRTGFLNALGALFRAGAAIDFKAQFPRTKPIVDLLPGHPRDEEKTVDSNLDDEFHHKRTEYSHGPLVGHRIPCDHLLFEARLSEAAFPWLAEHRVHYAPIMPAAGYIELIVQALDAAPLVIERLEFIQPCPIPRKPVRLQTELRAIPNSSSELTFAISTRSYDADSSSHLHSQGKVRLVGSEHLPDVPENLEEIDVSRFEPLAYASDDELYERFEAVLGETFQYGPYFRNMRNLRRDLDTDHLLFEVEVDIDLWRDGSTEGYILFPAMLDGGLQSFLYDLMLGADHFAIPRRAENVHFLRPPTVPRLTCRVTYPNNIRYEVDDKGQYSVPTGEWVSGSISCYDGATGDLVLHIEKYISFISDPRRAELPSSKHRISWQPKFLAGFNLNSNQFSETAMEPCALLAALEKADDGGIRTCRALEFAGDRDPESTALHGCVKKLSDIATQSEYWIVGNDSDIARSYYEAFHGNEAAIRFDWIDPTDSKSYSLETGLLRRNSVELLILHYDERGFSPDEWQFWQDLAVPGGLLLVCHGSDSAVDPAAAWVMLFRGENTTLFQAPSLRPSACGESAAPSPRWIIGEKQSRVSDWSRILNGSDVLALPYELLANSDFDPESRPWSREVQAIDIFFGRDPEDPTGERAVSHFVNFLQTLVQWRIDNADSPCCLTVITCGVILDAEHPRGSALWGAVRSLALEIGEEAQLEFRLVDIDTVEDIQAFAWLAKNDLREREIAIRKGELWVPRIVSDPNPFAEVFPHEDPDFRLFLEQAGQIDGLQMKTYDMESLAPRSVEIEVHAAALNFRDVMVTLGLLPALAYEKSGIGRDVGMEASGVVRSVGEEVKLLKAGDKVLFAGAGCIANRRVVQQHRVFLKPDNLSMEQAASSLSVYATAHYALNHLARLRKGQRVLIHSAMGGVGQAAIALAKLAGAEIYTTAGSDEKRSRLLELGVQAAFDSHSESWFSNVLDATSGEGVDIVLNSLAGPHVNLCLKILRAGGWHCEIGKIDIYSDSDLGLRVFRKNLRFAAIDMDRLMIDDPYLSRQLSEECIDLLDRGAVPPLPVTEFDYGDYGKALRLMTSGQHQGKLVLRAPLTPNARIFPIVDRRPYLDSEATYLVTGALGGFGQRLLPYLATAGARHLTLIDRDPERRRSEFWLRQSTTLSDIGKGVEIELVQGDVSIEADVQRCVASLNRPLKGVFHLAGVLDDRLLENLSPESISRVFAPKAYGALYLHRATADIDLDYFVMMSSTSSIFGNPGQINYSAANAFLDGLAAYRHRLGLPALSYNLAAVADAGMAAKNLGVLRLMRAAGMPPVSSRFAIANLDFAMRSKNGVDHIVTALFQKVLWKVQSSDYLRIGRQMRNQDAFAFGSDDQYTVDNVMVQIASKVADLCGHDEGDYEEPLSSFGLNSIFVAELGAYIQSTFNFQASALELMTTASCRSLASDIVFGKSTKDEDDSEGGDGEIKSVSAKTKRRTRRIPSPFASPIQDHFSPEITCDRIDGAMACLDE